MLIVQKNRSAIKFYLGLATVLAGFSAMGAYQYNLTGNQGWLTFDSTTTISSDLTVEVRKDNPGSVEGNYSDYGWYNLDTGDFGSLNNGVTATFTEEDRIGFWVKDNLGDVYLSTKPINSVTGNIFWGVTEAIADGYSITGNYGTHEYFQFKVNANKPSGQPLPGILATLLGGGCALGYLKKRKR